MTDLTEHIKVTPTTKAALDDLKMTERETYEDVIVWLLGKAKAKRVKTIDATPGRWR